MLGAAGASRGSERGPREGFDSERVQQVDVHFGTGEIAVITTLLGAVVAALSIIFKLLMAAKDAALVDCKAERDNYRSVANDAVRIMQAAMAKQREAQGEPPIKVIAPVLPEHQSPVTPAEQETAHQATLRAAVTAAALELGVPARSRKPDEPVDEAGEASSTFITKTAAVQAVMALPGLPATTMPEKPAEKPEEKNPE
jgi:hypothetical protein